ncbi:MAG: exo-alpha-sialidase [Clostridiales bacterium]|nr:exo-alpha-sialidase [Clostridiales bacterium]
MENYNVNVINNVSLPEKIEGQIVRLEGTYNFKPHIGKLPNGDVIMFVAHAHAEERITTHTAKNSPRAITSHVVMYRSSDNGKTWGWGHHVREMIGGHEPSVSIIDGTIFVLAHYQGDGGFPDSFAERLYPYSMLFRSIDGGITFDKTYIDKDFTNAKYEERIYVPRNIIKLSDGRLFSGVVVGNGHCAIYSNDNGTSWDVVHAEVKGCHYENVMRSFFTETVFFHSNSGRLLMLTRVDYDYAIFDTPLPYGPDNGGKTGLDNFDGEVLFESNDSGLTWTPIRAIGFPSLMYPSIVNLEDNKMLFTYTVREIPPEGSGCIHPKVGVQSIVIEEKPDGFIDFDLSKDVVVIDDCTPDSMRNAGCFGNTIMLDDGSLLTPFSYPLIDDDILEMANRKEYMNQGVFDYYASLQNTYNYRYKDFINDDPRLTELYLRRAFSALFLYAQCANKGGIATAVVKWKV